MLEFVEISDEGERFMAGAFAKGNENEKLFAQQENSTAMDDRMFRRRAYYFDVMLSLPQSGHATLNAWTTIGTMSSTNRMNH